MLNLAAGCPDGSRCSKDCASKPLGCLKVATPGTQARAANKLMTVVVQHRSCMESLHEGCWLYLRILLAGGVTHDDC